MFDGWEIEEDKEKGVVMVDIVVVKGDSNENSFQVEFRKFQGKLKNVYNIINFFREQLVLSNKEGSSKFNLEIFVYLVREIDRMNIELVCFFGKY